LNLVNSFRDLIVYFKRNYFGSYAVKSYSQEGEDMILKRIFEETKKGFYVDIGAHHPIRFSNTYYFYKLGWSGINVDAMPGSMKIFKRKRPRDINLEISVSSDDNIQTYYVFNEPALNGFDQYISEQRDEASDAYKIIKKIDLRTKTLSSILAENLPKDKKIDFMTIDVEGLDLNVINSNDWVRFKPTVVFIEILNSSLSDIESAEITQVLTNTGYKVFAKALNTVIFKLI